MSKKSKGGGRAMTPATGGGGGFFDFFKRSGTAVSEALDNSDDVPSDITVSEDHFLAPATGGRFAYLNDTVVHFAPEVRKEIGEAVHQVKEQLAGAQSTIASLKEQLSAAAAKLGAPK